jgi:hypothetical protein
MASIKLDMTNDWAEGPRLFGEALHELTKNLPVTFDIDACHNESGEMLLEFTGAPDVLAILIRRFEDDPGLRAELRDRIHYVPPMPGSCES